MLEEEEEEEKVPSSSSSSFLYTIRKEDYCTVLPLLLPTNFERGREEGRKEMNPPSFGPKGRR